MTTLYLDIETIPAQRLDLLARIASQHVDDAKKADEAHRKTSLNAAYGEIVCVCYAVDDGPVETIVRDWRDPADECRLLLDMVDVVRGISDGITIVAHNAEFDRNFIRQRLAVHDVKAPRALTGVGQKPWENSWQCTMQMWCGTPQGRISLDDLALALNLPGKDELHGSKVWDTVLTGQTDLVVAHCRQDVECLRAVHRRLE